MELAPDKVLNISEVKAGRLTTYNVFFIFILNINKLYMHNGL